MGKWMQGYMDRLEKIRRLNLLGGGEAKQAALRELGKMPARERIDKLLDEGSFEEIGSIVAETFPALSNDTPSDGLVMGFGKIDGRTVMAYAFDFSVLSGSLGNQAAWKLADLVEMAGRNGVPLVGMIDSVGARVFCKNGYSGYNGLAKLIKNYSRYAGVVPRISLVLGPCTGMLSMIPALSDFVIMHQDNGFLWLGGEIESDEAGSAEFHMEQAGQCDLIAESDAEAIAQAKSLLSFLPDSCWKKPAIVDNGDPADRREEQLLELMPDDPKYTYDIHEVIDLIVDNGEFFELKEDYATHLVVGFARFGGRSVGIVANNPDELSGIIEPNASDKYDRFMTIINSFNIPLVTLVDTTAFPPGDKWERLGVIRHGGKLLHSYAHLTVPKITMVLRRSYGGANIVMGCSKMFPDFVYTWPTTEFAPTGPETVVHAVFHKQLEAAKAAGNYDAVFNNLLSILKENFSVLMLGKAWTSYYTTHETIDPRDTRRRIIRALELTENKREELPEKRRSIKPA